MRAALIVLFGVSSISVVLRFNVGELLSFFAVRLLDPAWH
jgi:hypothetical protein